jgi:hypothetical protein
VNVHDLARRLQDLNAWVGRLEYPDIERRDFTRAPFGRARITIDPASTAPAASFNRNCICLCGADGGLTRDGLEQLLELYRGRGVARAFVWLSPGPDDARVREWLLPPAFQRVQWTRYPTLMLGALAEPARPHGFEIRAVERVEFAAARPALGNSVFEGFDRTLGEPGFKHFLLYDAGRPIALAALALFAGIGYLTYAGTVESERRRGAQSALIAHRAAVAGSLGCTQVVSQTLTMLEDSFANLQRCGFREIYEQEVYEVSVG